MSISAARRWIAAVAAAGLAALSAGCASPGADPLDGLPYDEAAADYLIGPGDTLQVFVWRSPELSVAVPVRPDGRISTPLIEDMVAHGKTPTALARDIEDALREYVQDPVATVIVTSFVGPYSQQVRVIGEAARPQAVAYRQNMTLLDLMIAVGGMTRYASGSRASILRKVDGKDVQYPVDLDSLLKDGDIRANRRLLPGDVLVIPQSWF